MKTLIHILIIMSLATFLMAQTDTTATEVPVEAPVETPVEEAVEETTEAADSTVTAPEEMVETTEVDSTNMEVVEMDSMAVDTTMMAADTTMMMEDTLVAPEPVMAWIQNDPAPTALAGLINEGNLYFWTNDVLDGLDFSSLPYISIVDPTMIAVSANDCLDIVCHLLASDGHGVNYVVVTKDDSSDVKIYNTITKVVAIEAPADSIVEALEAYLKDLAGMEYVDVTPVDTSTTEPVSTFDADELARLEARKRVQSIRNRQFRGLDNMTANPANLARDFDHGVTLDLLDLNVGIKNSLLTPGWYKEWWTVGGVWDEAMKAEYLSTIEDQNLTINVDAGLPTILGFTVGNFGFNLSSETHVKLSVPGNLIGLPFQDILLDEALDMSGFELESIPFMGKATLSYAHNVNLPTVGDIKLGLGLNTYKGFGYVRVVNQEFTQVMTQDSIITTSRSEGWATVAGINGNLEDLDTEELDPMDAGSDLSIGFDFGAIMDLQPLVNQEVEVQLSLRNIGASYKWSGLKHETYIDRLAIPAPGSADTDSIEQYQTSETIVHGTDETLTIDVPTVFNLAAYYQPVAKVIIGGGIEKAFTDESRFGYSPDLAIHYQVNLFPMKWLDISYYNQPRYGEPVHTFGTGLHFGFLETGMTVSFYNGLNSDAKGIGLGLQSSLHF